jgi:hypothetical protein
MHTASQTLGYRNDEALAPITKIAITYTHFLQDQLKRWKRRRFPITKLAITHTHILTGQIIEMEEEPLPTLAAATQHEDGASDSQQPLPCLLRALCALGAHAGAVSAAQQSMLRLNSKELEAMKVGGPPLRAGNV